MYHLLALFGLDTQPLSLAQGRRLDGFQARCLRRVLKILPSHVSRVSNETVRSQAAMRPLTEQLQRRKLLLFGSIASKPVSDPLRSSIFAGDSFVPRLATQWRRVGRPRLTWVSQVVESAAELTGSLSSLQEFFQKTDSQSRWRELVAAM